MPTFQIRDGASQGTRQHEDNSEILVELAKVYPENAGSFVKATMCIGLLDALASLPVMLFVAINWLESGLCNRPLRLWLSAHCSLQLLQLPIKLLIFRSVWHAQQFDSDMVDVVRQLTSSLQWTTNKVLAIATYAWLVLGMIWTMNSGTCMLTPMCKSVFLITVIRLIGAWVAFQVYFPRQQHDTAGVFDSVEEVSRGASLELINSMPLLEFSPELATDGAAETSCAVCLGEFEFGAALRRLSCGHKFHQLCIDKWLLQKKVCPLCLQVIDMAPCCSNSAHEKKMA